MECKAVARDQIGRLAEKLPRELTMPESDGFKIRFRVELSPENKVAAGHFGSVWRVTTIAGAELLVKTVKSLQVVQRESNFVCLEEVSPQRVVQILASGTIKYDRKEDKVAFGKYFILMADAGPTFADYIRGLEPNLRSKAFLSCWRDYMDLIPHLVANEVDSRDLWNVANFCVSGGRLIAVDASNTKLGVWSSERIDFASRRGIVTLSRVVFPDLEGMMQVAAVEETLRNRKVEPFLELMPALTEKELDLMFDAYNGKLSPAETNKIVTDVLRDYQVKNFPTNITPTQFWHRCWMTSQTTRTGNAHVVCYGVSANTTVVSPALEGIVVGETAKLALSFNDSLGIQVLPARSFHVWQNGLIVPSTSSFRDNSLWLEFKPRPEGAIEITCSRNPFRVVHQLDPEPRLRVPSSSFAANRSPSLSPASPSSAFPNRSPHSRTGGFRTKFKSPPPVPNPFELMAPILPSGSEFSDLESSTTTGEQHNALGALSTGPSPSVHQLSESLVSSMRIASISPQRIAAARDLDPNGEDGVRNEALEVARDLLQSRSLGISQIEQRGVDDRSLEGARLGVEPSASEKMKVDGSEIWMLKKGVDRDVVFQQGQALFLQLAEGPHAEGDLDVYNLPNNICPTQRQLQQLSEVISRVSRGTAKNNIRSSGKSHTVCYLAVRGMLTASSPTYYVEKELEGFITNADGDVLVTMAPNLKTARRLKQNIKLRVKPDLFKR